MLVPSREVGESVLIEDVVVMLVRVDANHVEISLHKQSGGRPRVVTLPIGQPVDVCYETTIVFAKALGSKARLGIEIPEGIEVFRLERTGEDT